ncbi:hypothetical protein J3Q64DRAFT_1702541 [Phycomyces blakesleeanus]|uniref:Uncharacterized protein n=2 Tax=Phycomyces blakesleeanus TaxID=4837 RepID=A0A167LUJ4_PHYB8|nr:hypothetical protein PHYBLDRAFT_66574 [Phycomyces blakesleeanus NRRL 1555(-)]OAD71129.1 hypothetical protein PHYBLDRAFT_66574 [Phycomyces blakesleeanus NRRL 1555(-)]|eukprot:XP_018289169.1 hypothetical protein PHYBLDRAFT_66574 [Phycomyces blakesleeanus NRRL 1555(-)]
MKFRGTIQTDGIGISVLKQTQGTTQGPNPRMTTTIGTEHTHYIHDFTPEQHESIRGRCVLIDPGRRDLLYCIHEESTVETPRCYRYTSNQENVRLKSGKVSSQYFWITQSKPQMSVKVAFDQDSMFQRVIVSVCAYERERLKSARGRVNYKEIRFRGVP